jgi:hypothetical protein
MLFLHRGCHIKWRLFLSILFIELSLNGCAIFGVKQSYHKRLPRVPSLTLPGGKGDNWRYLGTTLNNEIISEINESSIKNVYSNESLYSFQDRKTIINPNNFTYPENQPHYKYILGEWQLNCLDQTYIISSATIFNENGIKIASFDYSHDSNIRWIKFGKSSIGELQYNYVCLNKNRELGY